MSYDRFVFTVGYLTFAGVVAVSTLVGAWVAHSLAADISSGLAWGATAGLAVLVLGLLGDHVAHVGPVAWAFWLADLRADRQLQETGRNPVYQ